MYLTSGAKVRTIRFRSWGSFVSRYCFHSASVSSWEMRFRLLGSSFIGSSGLLREGGSRVDRPEGSRPLGPLDNLRRESSLRRLGRSREGSVLRRSLDGTPAVQPVRRLTRPEQAHLR